MEVINQDEVNRFDRPVDRIAEGRFTGVNGLGEIKFVQVRLLDDRVSDDVFPLDHVLVDDGNVFGAQITVQVLDNRREGLVALRPIL